VPNYFLGIDNGGSLTKAAVFDETGTQVSVAARRVPTISPAPGFVERDMDLLWQANCEAIAEVLASAKLDPASIRGIACTGHGKGLYLWGRDEKPAYNGIVSTDTRAWKYPEEWEKDGTAAKVYGKTFQRILACQPVSLLRWLKEHESAALERTKWIFEVKDYIRFRLTGEAYAEITDYSGSSLMNIRDGRFDRELLADFGLAEVFDLLPPLRGSTELCGRVSAEAAAATGLAPLTPVAGGMFDIDACAAATGVVDERNLCVIAGTWSINERVAAEPEAGVMMNSLFCIPGLYLIEESSPTSAANYDWFLNLFLESEKREAAERGISLYELAEAMVRSVAPDEQGIVFLPYIFGSNYDPRARASFVGLESTHTRPQVLRAVMEGIVFCHMVHIEKLLASGVRPEAVRLAGGAANSGTWVQIFADVIGLPVETFDAQELGALGCAMAAAVAGGVYADLREASFRMTRSVRRAEPNATLAAVYAKKFARYKKVSAALEKLWVEDEEL
jgi:L-xylulokinase